MSNLVNKWKEVLDHPDLNPISDNYRKQVTAILLENQERAVAEQGRILREDTAPFPDRKSTRLNSSHSQQSRMPSSA